MPQKRQDAERPDEAGIAVRTVGFQFPPGYRIERHRHDWHQLVYATAGVMTVATGEGSWVVPSHRAVWIPAALEHEVTMGAPVAMRTLYLRTDLPRLPRRCGVIPVPPLLRELVLEIIRRGMLYRNIAEHRRLIGVLTDQLVQTREAPLLVPVPNATVARRAAERALADLSANLSLETLARQSGASVRTIERRFVDETGMTFRRWLQRARALRALERLAAGDSVTEAGLAVGYDSTSAFIAMFRRVLGTTPGRYFKSDGSAGRAKENGGPGGPPSS